MESFDSGILMSLLYQLLFRAPVLLVWIIGLVLCLINYSKYPAVAVRCGIACGILLLSNLISIPLSILPIMFYSQMSATQIGYMSSGIGFVMTIFFVVGFALLLWAVWTRDYDKQ